MKIKLIILSILIALTIKSNAQSTGWSIQSSPTTQNLRSISYSDANTWVAVGDAATILHSSNGGITWTMISSPIVDGIHGVCMHGSLGLTVGIGGRILRTTNSGMNWIEVPRPTTRTLNSVSMSDNMSVAVGDEGFIYISTNNGLSWVQYTAGTASYLFGVSVNGTWAVGVGGQGTVVMGGTSGFGLTVIGDQLTFFYGTSFVNASTGWLVGSNVSPGYVIARSNNGGFGWTWQNAPITEQLFGVSFATVDSGTAVGGNGTIIHTMNGGTNWVSQTSGTTQILHGVSFATSNLGIAVGDLGTILRTTTGGLTGIRPDNNSLPTGFELLQNYPNPFNPSTKIKYQLPKNSFVKLAVFDVLGTKVKDLVNSQQTSGNYSVEFDGANLSSGIYFYKLETNGFTETRKMILTK